MLKTFATLAVGPALLVLVSAASAAQCAQLSDVQMDSVTAGNAYADAAALAFGELFSDTFAHSSTNVSTVTPRSAGSQAFSLAAGGGGFLFFAAAASHAQSYATLP
jgi:hypothetical protein